MKKVKNPLPTLIDKKRVEDLFGKEVASKIMTKDVYSYECPTDGTGDLRS